MSQSSSGLLLLAVAAVFGTPFVYFLQASLRGSFSLGAPALIAMGAPLSSLFLWATTLALGSIWLGSSLALGSPGRVRRGTATGLILLGMMLLVITARLASSSVLV